IRKRKTELFATLKAGPARPSTAVIPERIRTIEPLVKGQVTPTRTVKLGVRMSLRRGVDFVINKEMHHRDAPVKVGDLQVWDIVELGERYRIERELGRGGMGRVFVARDLKLDRQVAIKLLSSGAHPEEELRRFAQEARAAGSLNHPNILAVHDIGSCGAGPYIVSELLDGSTLRERLDGKPLPLKAALRYTVDLAKGLAAAHEHGVIH